MKASSSCKIDGVKVGEISADLFETVGVLKCKFAYLISSSGRTCGYGNFNSWSEETIQKFKDLIENMEKDILVSMFEEGSTIPSVSIDEVTTEDGVPGL